MNTFSDACNSFIGSKKAITSYIMKQQLGTAYLFKQKYSDAKMPQRMTKGSAGYDLYVYKDMSINPREAVRISTGICLNPASFESLFDEGQRLVGMVFLRSGWSFRNKCIIPNAAGVIDMDYTYSKEVEHNNEIMIQVINLSEDIVEVKSGDRIAQIVFLPFEDFDIEATGERKGGFGSTDAKQEDTGNDRRHETSKNSQGISKSSIRNKGESAQEEV